MDSIIVAHLPDFETWQSSCLLFDDISTVLNNVSYNKLQTGESVFWSHYGLELIFNKYTGILFITIHLREQNITKVSSYYSIGQICHYLT